MPDYSLTSTDVMKLIGSQFDIRSKDGDVLRFEILGGGPGGPLQGAEAYGMFVDCHHPKRGRIRSFFKIFRYLLHEREARTRFIINKGLAKEHDWLFSAVPFAAVDMKVLNGTPVTGHVARQIVGPGGATAQDLESLREDDLFRFEYAERKRFAAQLCCAVEGLERQGIAHGDLSSRNILIGTSGDGQPAALLCDFDTFYEKTQVLLPYESGGFRRPIGSAGYQTRQVLEAASRGDSNVCVTSDRFALAVLVCEIMTWQIGDQQKLKRISLVTDQMVHSGSLNIPGDIRSRWPEGMALLEEALQATSHDGTPSPADWLYALGVKVGSYFPEGRGAFDAVPIVTLYHRRGVDASEVAKCRLTSQKGDFGSLMPELAPIRFQLSNGLVRLGVGWPHPVQLRRKGVARELGTGPVDGIEVYPGDAIVTNSWQLNFAR